MPTDATKVQYYFCRIKVPTDILTVANTVDNFRSVLVRQNLVDSNPKHETQSHHRARDKRDCESVAEDFSMEHSSEHSSNIKDWVWNAFGGRFIRSISDSRVPDTNVNVASLRCSNAQKPQRKQKGLGGLEEKSISLVVGHWVRLNTDDAFTARPCNWSAHEHRS
jgi:hypothetical protein